MKQEIRALLKADASLSASASGGINWGIHPQSVSVPYIVLTQVSGYRDHTVSGPAGPRMMMIQADCYGLNQATVEAIASRVEAILDGYKTRPFQGIFFIAKRDLPEAGGDENEVIHRVSLDFNVVKNHEEQP